MTDDSRQLTAPTAQDVALEAGRAVGGAMLFSLPLYMTLEMWALGMLSSSVRLAILVVVTLPILAVLAAHLGFRRPEGLTIADHVADALMSYAIGVLTSAVMLLLFGVITSDLGLMEVVGLLAIHSVPASIGAAVGRTQTSQDDDEGDGPIGSGGFGHELILMAVGAATLAVAIAPTEEVVIIATQVTGWRSVGLALLSMAAMQALVYMVGYPGQHTSEQRPLRVLLSYTASGYVVALAVCLGLLWAFAQTDGLPGSFVLVETVVLAVPGTIGAAAARLIL